MNREETLNDLDRAPAQAFNDDVEVEITKNVEILINSIFDDFESKTCVNCKNVKENDGIYDDHKYTCKLGIGNINNYGNIGVTEDFYCNRYIED